MLRKKALLSNASKNLSFAFYIYNRYVLSDGVSSCTALITESVFNKLVSNFLLFQAFLSIRSKLVLIRILTHFPSELGN